MARFQAYFDLFRGWSSAVEFSNATCWVGKLNVTRWQTPHVESPNSTFFATFFDTSKTDTLQTKTDDLLTLWQQRPTSLFSTRGAKETSGWLRPYALHIYDALALLGPFYAGKWYQIAFLALKFFFLHSSFFIFFVSLHSDSTAKSNKLCFIGNV